jgi:hypothetical protein
MPKILYMIDDFTENGTYYCVACCSTQRITDDDSKLEECSECQSKIFSRGSCHKRQRQ